MSSTLSNFIIGIGFEFDKKGAKEIGSGIDSIKSKALQAGAVLAGAFGIKALTVDFANATDSLGKFGETFGLTANDIMGFGNALSQEGGSLESFMSQIENIERLRAGLQVGDAGFISLAGKAGIDTGPLIAATDATEAYLSLANQFQDMTQQQRLNAASALGLDEASIRLLSSGRDAVEATIAKFQNIRPITDDMTKGAAEFNRQWLEAEQNVGGVADAISREILPVLTQATTELNSWFETNRAGTGGFVDEAMQRFKELELTDFTFYGNLVNIGRGLREEFDPTSQESTSDSTIGLLESGSTTNDSTGSFIPSVQESTSDSIIDFFKPGSISDDVDTRFLPSLYGNAQNGGVTNTSNTTSRVSVGQASTTQNINVELTLDGEVINRQVVKVVDNMAQTAIDDIASSTGG